MAIKTYTEQLESVQSTIEAIETGSQSYSINGRSLTKADLAELYEREKWLRTQVAKEEREASGIVGARTRYVEFG